ncbi:hypothetical protein [Nitratifractor sp.]|uniref:hypothetical protein n=1 Tax=Nitratifractor sp. TaxID=2268144 RepID=UPI0025D3C664|nr:hypothetical protein [Nitratifractor sp.]
MNSKKKAASAKHFVIKREKRRSFLKKAVYSAPTLVALGTLMRPEKGHADFGGPPSDAGGW